MTTQEFRSNITKHYKTDNVVNYILCTVFILIGFYFLINFFQIKYSEPESSLNPWSLFAAAIPISFGLYGFWRIKQDYVVNEVFNNSSIDRKRLIVEEYLSKVKVVFRTNEGNFFSYRYRNMYFGLVDLKVYLDEDKILYNIGGADRSGFKGFIDFGLTRRAGKMFKNHLTACL